MDRADLVGTTRRVLQCIAGRTLETAPQPASYPAELFTDAAIWACQRDVSAS